MKFAMPPMLPAYLVGNVSLVVLGYESATTTKFPHWVIAITATFVSATLAFQASRTLGRAYRREDRTFAVFERLWIQSRAQLSSSGKLAGVYGDANDYIKSERDSWE